MKKNEHLERYEAPELCEFRIESQKCFLQTSDPTIEDPGQGQID